MAAKSRTAVVDPVKFIPRNVQIAMLLAIVLGLLFIKPFIGTILFSALIAFIFNPVYQRVYLRTKNSGLAIIATILTAMLSFILPLIFVIGVTVSQANSMVDKFRNDANLGPAQIESVTQEGTDRINKLVAAIPGGENIKIDTENLKDKIKDGLVAFAKGFANFIKSAGGAFFGFISTAILAFFLIAGLLRHQAKLIDFVKTISPFQPSVTKKYIDRAGAMTKAMVKGQLLIAIAQGFASAFSLWLVGIDYFWFFLIVLTFLSFIPLGGGILTIPIGIIIMLTGNVGRGLFVLLWHFLVVTNIDNFLRPRLVPKNVRLDSALIILSVFAGIAVFGGTGVIFGPVIMILLITTFEMYADYSKQAKLGNAKLEA